MWFRSWGWAREEVQRFKLTPVDKTGQQIWDTSLFVSREFLREKFDSLPSTLHKSVQNAEMYVEIWHQTLQE